VVVATAVVVPIVLTSHGGGSTNTAGGKGSQTTSGGNSYSRPTGTAWQAPGNDLGQYNNGYGPLSYANDMIVTTDVSVTAFERDNGKKLWQVAPPVAGQVICGLTRTIANDALGIAFGPTNGEPNLANCASVGLLNLKTRQYAWTKPLPQTDPAGLPDPTGASMAFAGTSVFVGSSSNFTQFAVADGTVQSSSAFTNGNNSCEVSDIAASTSSVYVLGTCLGLGPSYYTVGEVDATDAKLIAVNPIQAADVKLPIDPSSTGGESGLAAFVSLSPLVLVLHSNVGTNAFYGALVGLTDALKVSWSDVQTTGDPKGLDLTTDQSSILTDGLHDYNRATVSGNTVYLVTTFYVEDASGDGGGGYYANKVAAVDATTGKQRWETGVPGVGFSAAVGVDGTTVYAVGETVGRPADTENPDLVLGKFDANSGKLLGAVHQKISISGAGMTLPAEAALEYCQFIMADGRAYGSTTRKPLQIGMGYPQVFSVG
jgi:hypothetical protein